ncbi:MAG: DNA primase [Candidatus Aceula meridiana]|nr:DNA primase [Candidatus Aceula meridiana]
MGLIPEDVIAQVLDRSDITEVVSEYLPLKKAGRNFKACCPFHHEKTPSFVVNRDKQIFHCFGCGAGGNVVSFVMQHEHMDFPTALKVLAQKAGIEVPDASDERTQKTKSLKEALFQANDLAVNFFHDALVSGEKGAKAAQDYLKQRRVKLETVKALKLGFAQDQWEGLITHLRNKKVSLSLMEKSGLVVAKEKGEGFYDRFRDRIIFPIFDVRNRCIGFGARTMSKDVSAKYINSPETLVYTKGHHLYGLHLVKNAIVQKDVAVIVEGYMDFLMPYQEGFEPIVASLGTALTTEQIRLLRRYTKNVVMLFDSDAAGESAMMRSLDTLIEEDMNVKVAVLGDGQDPDSFVSKHGVVDFQKRIDEAQTLFDYKLRILTKKYDRTSIEGRARISAEMLETIAKVRNHILKEGYVRKLAQELSVSEQALVLEMEKTFKAPVAAEVPIKKKTSGPVRIVERNLLRLLLEEGVTISSIQEEVKISDFQDDQVRPIVEQIFDLSNEKEIVNASKLIQYFHDQETVSFLSELMASPQPVAEDKDVLRKDYIHRIKSDRQKLERRTLRDAIEAAEAKGDETKLNELKEKFNQLIKS